MEVAVVLLILGLAGLIVFAAGRIILGWLVPRGTMKQIDAGANAIGKFCLQLVVIVIAAGIVWAVWAANHP